MVRKSFSDSIVFSDNNRKNESQFVCSSNIKLKDVINIASEFKQSISDTNFDFGDNNTPYMIENDSRTLHRAAMLLKNDIKKVNGIETSPLNPRDITEENAKNILPDNLITFLSLICEEISDNKLSSKSTKVLSIAQDIINVASNGRKAMPKNVALALALKTRLNSKEFVEICNKNGHCVSYHTILRIEAKWMNDILDKEEGYASIPTNLYQIISLKL